MTSPPALVSRRGFAGTFLLVAVWEALRPRRPRLQSRWTRWPMNLGLMVLDTLVVRLSFPVLAAGFAYDAEARGWGLLNQVSWPFWAKFWLAFLALDLVIYVQHWAFHRVPLFWRLHRVHHADLDFDASTGVRFHPGETLLSAVIKTAASSLPPQRLHHASGREKKKAARGPLRSLPKLEKPMTRAAAAPSVNDETAARTPGASSGTAKGAKPSTRARPRIGQRTLSSRPAMASRLLMTPSPPRDRPRP